MRFLVVDDEKMMLERLGSMLCSVSPEAEILSFTWPEDGLEAAKRQLIDVAFLDIEMGGMTGLELAARLKKTNPDIHIVFVTGFSQYAVEAFQMHATGYLLKPVDEEGVRRELTFIYGTWDRKCHIRVQTFGGFGIFVDGKPVRFGRAKAKELLAYLVDRRGAAVTTAQAYAVLYEDAVNPASGTGYFRNIVRELKKSLKAAGIERILKRSFNSISIVPDEMDCDYYRFLQGDPVAVNQYRDDYLPEYSWAEFKNAELGFGKQQGSI